MAAAAKKISSGFLVVIVQKFMGLTQQSMTISMVTRAVRWDMPDRTARMRPKKIITRIPMEKKGAEQLTRGKTTSNSRNNNSSKRREGGGRRRRRA